MDVFLTVPGRINALRAHHHRRAACICGGQALSLYPRSAGMGFARGAVPWQQIRENVILKLAACAAREIIANKKARVRMLETENAALRDKIEQAERAIRPLLK